MSAAPPRRPLAVIGAATSAGAYGPGQERAPRVLRSHGLLDVLREAGRPVRDVGDVASSTHRPDPAHPDAANPDLVRAAVDSVANAVAAAFDRGEDVLVLGGDCTVELGTVAGARADGSSVGLVYIDLDADLNTPATGDGVLDWMVLAHLLDVPGSLPQLAHVGPQTPLLAADGVFLVGTANVTPPEQAVLEALDLRVAYLAEVVEDHDAVAAQVAAWAERFDRVLVHVDIDVLHYSQFPLAHEIRDSPGLTIDQLDRLTARLRRLPGWAGLTLCEVNPDHAIDEHRQFGRLIELLNQGV